MKRTSKLVDVIHFGACRDPQFAADAEFSGRPRGAFTHYRYEALDELEPGATYGDWYERIADKLPNYDYDQEPQINAFARALKWKIPVTKK